MRVCTIVAKNYLAHARVLADSFLKHNRDGSCTVLVIDGVDGLDPAAEPFELLTPDQIGLEDFELMAGIYDVLELSTAVKPWLLRTLLRADEHVAYLDPDIEVFDDLGELEELIDRHRLVLTPHNTEPLPEDGKTPTQTDILLSGAYNLGFIGIGRGDDSDRLLDWWARRLARDCRFAPDRGLFVDQRWIDLVPGLVSDHHILRDPGYNLAYWNLPSRQVERDGGGYTVNGRPLRFFHFSGYDPDRPRQLSKHQTRIELGSEPVLREICDRYAARLREHGYEEVRKVPYGLGQGAGGVRLDAGTRATYRAAVEHGGLQGSLFEERGAADFDRWRSGGPAPDGVNLIGYLRSEMGVGEAGRAVAAALAAVGVPVRPVLVSSPSHREEHEFGSDGEPAAGVEMTQNVVCVNADALPGVAQQDSIRRMLGAHNSIGFWWWEVSSFPATLSPSFDFLDEVWVGSEHVAEAVRPAASIPVRKMLLPVAPAEPEQATRAELRMPEGFVFMFVFDYRAVPERKNPLGLVEAYRRAFPEPADTQLVLKCVNQDAYPEAHRKLRQAAGERTDITLVTDYVSAARKNAMIAACDCYVSLHRSEGFGLTLAEAMYFGRPAIATGYSGNLEFMTAENSYLVDYDLRPIGEGADPYPADGTWADPDLDHAAMLMRAVVESPEEAAQRGARAAADLRRLHSPEAAGEEMHRQLLAARAEPRRSRLSAQTGSEPAVATAREARQRVLVGPPKRSRTRFGGPLRDALLRLIKPWTVHQQDVDLMLVSAIDQLNKALRDLDPVRDVAEGWRSLPAAAELELETFEDPLAGHVMGYRAEDAGPAAAAAGSGMLPPEEVVAERRRPFLRLLEGHAPLLDAGCGRGELLDLLRAAGIEASGVEPSPDLAEVARAKGHEVAGEEISEHLERAEPGSLGAVFSAAALGLETRQLVRLLALVRDRLAPGGPLIAESLNPDSPEALKYGLAGPSRTPPLLPEVALALVRAAGFSRAFVFYPEGSGDVTVDRHSANRYALVANAPGGQGRPD